MAIECRTSYKTDPDRRKHKALPPAAPACSSQIHLKGHNFTPDQVIVTLSNPVTTADHEYQYRTAMLPRSIPRCSSNRGHPVTLPLWECHQPPPPPPPPPERYNHHCTRPTNAVPERHRRRAPPPGTPGPGRALRRRCRRSRS